MPTKVLKNKFDEESQLVCDWWEHHGRKVKDVSDLEDLIASIHNLKVNSVQEAKAEEVEKKEYEAIKTFAEFMLNGHNMTEDIRDRIKSEFYLYGGRYYTEQAFGVVIPDLTKSLEVNKGEK